MRTCVVCRESHPEGAYRPDDTTCRGCHAAERYDRHTGAVRVEAWRQLQAGATVEAVAATCGRPVRWVKALIEAQKRRAT